MFIFDNTIKNGNVKINDNFFLRWTIYFKLDVHVSHFLKKNAWSWNIPVFAISGLHDPWPEMIRSWNKLLYGLPGCTDMDRPDSQVTPVCTLCWRKFPPPMCLARAVINTSITPGKLESVWWADCVEQHAQQLSRLKPRRMGNRRTGDGNSD